MGQQITTTSYSGDINNLINSVSSGSLWKHYYLTTTYTLESISKHIFTGEHFVIIREVGRHKDSVSTAVPIREFFATVDYYKGLKDGPVFRCVG
jgi:hypothetical protein